MQGSKNRGGWARNGRNAKGQWTPGVSGNRKGRPTKKAAVPKSLADHLADAMMEDIPVIGSDGKVQMVPAFEAVAQHAVRSLPGSKPRELMSTLKWIEGMGVFETLQRRAGTWTDGLSIEEVRERLVAHLARLKEEQARR